MEHRPTFEQLDDLTNNDLIRLRLMADHVLHSRRVERIAPFVPSRSVAKRLANQMTDAQITAKINEMVMATMEEPCPKL